jgi:3-oxoacid CoA-transferase B subunit
VAKKYEGIARELIALRIANDIPDGTYANLGIGIPTLVSNWIEGRDIILQAECGMLNTGPLAFENDIDQDCINASCQPVTELPGASYFCSSESFAMIRGGFMDVAVLGALQVAENGDYSGWNVPSANRGKFGNIGGSMDLSVGAKKLYIAMEHVTNTGEAKILKTCTYPITAKGVVKKIFTNLAVIDVTPNGLVLREVAPGMTPEDIQSVTEAKLVVDKNWKEIAL